MNLVRFLEYRFQELNLENEKYRDAFKVSIDSQIKASHNLLALFRKILTFFMSFKLLIEYFLVLLHLRKKPEPALINRIKKQQLAEKAAVALVKPPIEDSSNNVVPIDNREKDEISGSPPAS